MAPIYDTDIAEERWSHSEWKHYELWEKVEVRLRRHKRLWIAGTVLLFLGLSAIPTVVDQRPKWRALDSVRVLGQEINRIKKEAAMEHAAFRIRFTDHGALAYQVERLDSCAVATGTVVRSVSLQVPAEGESGSHTVLLSPQDGAKFNLPGLVDSFCYDPIRGVALPSQALESAETPVFGFAMMPAEDVQGGRTDRLATLLLSGTSGEVSFE